MEQTASVPKKNENKHYSVAACDKLRAGITGSELFAKVYGRDGSKQEVQAFINRLNPNRANPGQDIAGKIVEVRPELHDMTLAEFFDIKP